MLKTRLVLFLDNLVVSGYDVPKIVRSFLSIRPMTWILIAWPASNHCLPANFAIRVFWRVLEQVAVAAWFI